MEGSHIAFVDSHQSLAVSSREPETIAVPLKGKKFVIEILLTIPCFHEKILIKIRFIPISGTDGSEQIHRTSNLCPSKTEDSLYSPMTNFR